MGRKKIRIARIADERNRHVTFMKRKNGLLKKAMELSVLCDSEIALVVFAPRGAPGPPRIYDYASDSVAHALRRLAAFVGERESRTNACFHDDDPVVTRTGPADPPAVAAATAATNMTTRTSHGARSAGAGACAGTSDANMEDNADGRRREGRVSHHGGRNGGTRDDGGIGGTIGHNNSYAHSGAHAHGGVVDLPALKIPITSASQSEDEESIMSPIPPQSAVTPVRPPPTQRSSADRALVSGELPTFQQLQPPHSVQPDRSDQHVHENAVARNNRMSREPQQLFHHDEWAAKKQMPHSPLANGLDDSPKRMPSNSRMLSSSATATGGAVASTASHEQHAHQPLQVKPQRKQSSRQMERLKHEQDRGPPDEQRDLRQKFGRRQPQESKPLHQVGLQQAHEQHQHHHQHELQHKSELQQKQNMGLDFPETAKGGKTTTAIISIDDSNTSSPTQADSGVVRRPRSPAGPFSAGPSSSAAERKDLFKRKLRVEIPCQGEQFQESRDPQATPGASILSAARLPSPTSGRWPNSGWPPSLTASALGGQAHGPSHVHGQLQSRVGALGQAPHNDTLWTPHGGDFPVDPLMTPKSTIATGQHYPPLPSPTNAGLLGLLSARNPPIDSMSGPTAVVSNSILSVGVPPSSLGAISSYTGLSTSGNPPQHLPPPAMRAVSCTSAGMGSFSGSVLGKRPAQGMLDSGQDSTLPALTGATITNLAKQYGSGSAFAPGSAR